MGMSFMMLIILGGAIILVLAIVGGASSWRCPAAAKIGTETTGDKIKEWMSPQISQMS